MRQTKHLNIFISANPDAVSEARRIDDMVRAGSDPGRLAGVPVSIKDNICTRTMPTTCASRMLEGYVSPYEATVVERLRREGAIIVGKTNLDEFAMGITTEFSAYGPTLNPRDPRCVPGARRGAAPPRWPPAPPPSPWARTPAARSATRPASAACGVQAHIRHGEPVRPGLVRQQHRAGGLVGAHHTRPWHWRCG